MYRCRIFVVTVAPSGRPTTFRRDLVLPFVPSVAGPELGFACPTHHWSAEIISCIYESETGEFHIELADWEGVSEEDAQRELGPQWTRLGQAA